MVFSALGPGGVTVLNGIAIDPPGSVVRPQFSVAHRASAAIPIADATLHRLAGRKLQVAPAAGQDGEYDEMDMMVRCHAHLVSVCRVCFWAADSLVPCHLGCSD